jgi:hypothetical protein
LSVDCRLLLPRLLRAPHDHKVVFLGCHPAA